MTATDAKEKLKLKKLNELAYEEFILSINMSEGSGKVVFQIIKGCKMTDHKDGDTCLAWERLTDKSQ